MSAGIHSVLITHSSSIDLASSFSVEKIENIKQSFLCTPACIPLMTFAPPQSRVLIFEKFNPWSSKSLLVVCNIFCFRISYFYNSKKTLNNIAYFILYLDPTEDNTQPPST